MPPEFEVEVEEGEVEAMAAEAEEAAAGLCPLWKMREASAVNVRRAVKKIRLMLARPQSGWMTSQAWTPTQANQARARTTALATLGTTALATLGTTTLATLAGAGVYSPTSIWLTSCGH